MQLRESFVDKGSYGLDWIFTDELPDEASCLSEVAWGIVGIIDYLKNKRSVDPSSLPQFNATDQQFFDE